MSDIDTVVRAKAMNLVGASNIISEKFKSLPDNFFLDTADRESDEFKRKTFIELNKLFNLIFYFFNFCKMKFYFYCLPPPHIEYHFFSDITF